MIVAWVAAVPFHPELREVTLTAEDGKMEVWNDVPRHEVRDRILVLKRTHQVFPFLGSGV